MVQATKRPASQPWRCRPGVARDHYLILNIQRDINYLNEQMAQKERDKVKYDQDAKRATTIGLAGAGVTAAAVVISLTPACR